MDEPPCLAVVVPTRDRPALLAGCLAALCEAGVPTEDVVVVDSASRDPEAIAPARALGIAVLRCDRPGASLARNAGWRTTRHPIVAFVDDDVRVGPTWVQNITAPFADPRVVLVTGGVGVDAPVGDRAVATTDDVAGGRFGLERTGHVGASANVAVRRDVLEVVGGFDELLGAGGRFRAAEDLDLFDRLLRHGDGWHAASAHAVHDQWRSRRDLLGLELSYGIGFGARLAKLLRTDRSRARALVGFEARRFVRDVVADVRRSYEFGLVSRAVWACGVAAGAVRAVLVPVTSGHFRPRRLT
jgi:glycosyltransferase involved in cell wall biosynthesis